MIQKFREKNIHRGLAILLLAGFALLRMMIAYSQRVYLLPEGSGIDDMLMVRAAKAMVEGGWLGAYGGMTIAKNMGFALWLAALHATGIPFLLANAALWLGASGLAARALRPLFPGNLSRLLLFVFFSFYPVSFAFFTQRAYRDAIFPALCLLLFAGVAGMGLRMEEPKNKGFLLCALAAGAGLGGGWLVREDGAALLVFAVCALLAVVAFVLWKNPKNWKKPIVCLVPFGMLAVAVLVFSGVNQAQYKVFAVNDLNSGSFPKAYGAMVAVSTAESGFSPRRPVSRKALQAMYEQVPTLALLEEELEQGPVLNGFAAGEPKEYGGSFYFALRLAADYSGYLPDGAAAEAFWAQLEQEIRLAVEEGRLQSVRPAASTLPRWNSQLLGPTMQEAGKGFITLLTLQDCNPRPAESLGREDTIAQTADFLHSRVQSGYRAGTDQPYYNGVQRLLFLLCDSLIWVYRILVWPLLGVAAVSLWKSGRKAVARAREGAKAPAEGLSAVLLLGLLLSVLLRIGVAAYMEAAAFGIGTYIMYLSAAGPPLLLGLAIGLGLLEWPRLNKHPENKNMAK